MAISHPSAKNGVTVAPRRKRRSESGSNHSAPPALALDDPSLYLNRDLSLLAFQVRVLEEAQDETVPLLERVKFLSIVGSNLDEFFMVRVAGLKRQVAESVLDSGPDGMTPAAQLGLIREMVNTLLRSGHECLQRQILPTLRKVGIHVVDYAHLNS